MKKIAWLPAAVLTILVPILLLLSSIWILIHPVFLDHEYGLKNFPPDEYGFTTSDRLLWGKLSLTYLINDADINFLADLKFEDGKPIYNPRELSHMADVKSLVQLMNKILAGSLLLFILLTILAWLTKWMRRYWQAIITGGWVTLGVVAFILAATLINFDELFTQFHHLFFTGDTWLFYANDTLIRLYPLKLWSDAFIFMGAFTLVGILAAIIGGNVAFKKSK
jgi:integral membrane protein (TIGR01906 family)